MSKLIIPTSSLPLDWAAVAIWVLPIIPCSSKENATKSTEAWKGCALRTRAISSTAATPLASSSAAGLPLTPS